MSDSVFTLRDYERAYQTALESWEDLPEGAQVYWYTVTPTLVGEYPENAHTGLALNIYRVFILEYLAQEPQDISRSPVYLALENALELGVRRALWNGESQQEADNRRVNFQAVLATVAEWFRMSTRQGLTPETYLEKDRARRLCLDTLAERAKQAWGVDIT